MPTWPTTLPRSPKPGNYSEQPLPNAIRSSVDAGLPKQRRRFTGRIIQAALSWDLTADQLDDFETFWRDDLQDGVLEFSGPHPRTGATVRCQFDASEPYSVRDAGRPDWVTVSAKLLILP